MNTLASYNWIKEYLNKADSVEDFSRKMTTSGMSVEYTHDYSKKFEKMVVGEIVEVNKHPDADKLNVVTTSIGKKKVEIVCGGVNLEPGQKVAVALPGASVLWHGEGEPVVLEETKIRGVSSHGMICAAEEIGFEKLMQTSEEGPLIWDITDITDAKAGTPLVDALDLNDTVFDIEVTTNRPDAMSIIGLAREAWAVEAGEFNFEPQPIEEPGEDSASLSVEVKDEKLCPRYQAVVMDNVKVGPSPWWLQKKLLLAGHRPINNLVDITNYILHEYGRPMHTFDYDKLEGNKIVVRRAKSGEKMVALDDNEYEMTKDMLVIADAKKPVAVAGVMGGKETGTWEGTTKIVFEIATFDPVSVRRTSRALNLMSDSQQLFEKGLSVQGTEDALAKAISMVKELAGGEVVSTVKDIRAAEYKPLVFPFSPAEINDRLGIEIEEKEQVRIMESLGFELKKNGEIYDAVVPFWRDHDIEDSVDFSEEIARVYGYYKFPAKVPTSEVIMPPEDPQLVWQGRIKEYLRAAGATELYHYSFASLEDLTDWGYSEKDALAFVNPLSVDQKYLRVSLAPTVLRTLERNQGVYPSALVFELANIYTPRKGDLPIEEPHCVIAGFGSKYNDFLFVKGVMERLFSDMGVDGYELDRNNLSDHWHPGRSAYIKHGNTILGMIGELSPTHQSKFGLDHRTVVCQLNLTNVVPLAKLSKKFEPVSEFPSVKRDVAFVVDRKTEYVDVEAKLLEIELIDSVEVFDVYEGDKIEEGKKSMALHLSFRASDRTLSSEEADEALSTASKVLEKEFSANIRG